MLTDVAHFLTIGVIQYCYGKLVSKMIGKTKLAPKKGTNEVASKDEPTAIQLRIESLLARQDQLQAENAALKAANERAKKKTAQQQQGGGILIVARPSSSRRNYQP
jgi:phage tail sheath protein FI